MTSPVAFPGSPVGAGMQVPSKRLRSDYRSATRRTSARNHVKTSWWKFVLSRSLPVRLQLAEPDAVLPVETAVIRVVAVVQQLVNPALARASMAS